MTEPAELPAPAPQPNLETQPFWDATAEGRFLLLRCENGHVIWYPRFLCPECRSTETSWEEASGRGTVYTYTVVGGGGGGVGPPAPPGPRLPNIPAQPPGGPPAVRYCSFPGGSE